MTSVTNLRLVSWRVCVALLMGLAFTGLLVPVRAAQKSTQLPGGKDFKEMRIIDGERMVFSQEKPKSIEEHVELRLIAASEEDENLTVRADKIEFFYAEDTGELARVTATGNVSFIMDPSKVELHGDTVIWLTAENKVELRGSPKAIGEGWTLTGGSIVYYIEEGRGEVRKPRGEFVIPQKNAAEEKGDKDEKSGQ